MKVIGIDLSLTGTGIVTLRKDKPYVSRLIKTKPTKTPTEEVRRLMKIKEEVAKELEGADLVAIEGISFMSRHSTALAQLAGLSYLVREELVNRGIPFIIVAPTTLKKFITGKGNADKDVVMMETYKRYHVTITDNNICDAYILSRCAESLLDESIKLSIPQKEVIELLKKQLYGK